MIGLKCNRTFETLLRLIEPALGVEHIGKIIVYGRVIRLKNKRAAIVCLGFLTLLACLADAADTVLQIGTVWLQRGCAFVACLGFFEAFQLPQYVAQSYECRNPIWLKSSRSLKTGRGFLEPAQGLHCQPVIEMGIAKIRFQCQRPLE